jgi:hypothetical protein
MRTKLLWSSVVLAVAVAGCGPKAGTADDGADDDSADDVADDSSGDDSSGDDSSGDDDVSFPDAPSCGEQSVPIMVENLGDPPDLLIVLDRSGSMTAPILSFPPDFTPKWTIMMNALNALATELQDNIRFGLVEFPADDNCGVGPAGVRVPVDLNQAPEIATYFATRAPNGNTPADLGLSQALSYYGTIPVNPAGRFVLFATDGEPNCGGGDPEVSGAAQTVAAVEALASAGIPTYVLGFGGGFVDDSVLNNSALAGGVPRPGGPPHYYAANSAAELQMALDTIAGGIVIPSCSYALASPPPDPDLVTVSLDGVPVPRSTAHTDGWDYYPDANTITFFGSYCEMIESGAITDVSFEYGCPGPVID